MTSILKKNHFERAILQRKAIIIFLNPYAKSTLNGMRKSENYVIRLKMETFCVKQC